MNEFDLECEIHGTLELLMGRSYKFDPELETELREMFPRLRAGDTGGMEARLAEIKEQIKSNPKKRCWTGGYADRMSDRDYY